MHKKHLCFCSLELVYKSLMFCGTEENQVKGAVVPVASSPRNAAQRNGVLQQDFQSFPSKKLRREFPALEAAWKLHALH